MKKQRSESKKGKSKKNPKPQKKEEAVKSDEEDKEVEEAVDRAIEDGPQPSRSDITFALKQIDDFLADHLNKKSNPAVTSAKKKISDALSILTEGAGWPSPEDPSTEASPEEDEEE